MNEDVAEALAAECSGDRPHQGPASWSPAWGQWLCPNCRSCRTEAELRMTLAEGKKPMRWLPGDAALVRLWPSRSTGMSGRWMTC